MQMMVVTSLEEEWTSLTTLLGKSFPPNSDKTSLCTEGQQKHVYELVTDERSMGLHCAVIKPDLTDEETIQALDNCFKATPTGINTFILLIPDGRYTSNDKRIMETLQANFGVEVFKFLIVLSVDSVSVVTEFNDGLLESINACDGRFCRLTGQSATSDEISTLLEMVEYMLNENGACGYTQSMYTEAHKRNTEDAAMKILSNKLQEAEEKEGTFLQLIGQNEENRGREMEELKSKHAEERKREVTEKRQHEAKRERCEDALRSHKEMLQLSIKPAYDEDAKQTTIVLLGMSGSGKSSARNIILERVSNQYSISPSGQEAPLPTLVCERREVRREEGRRLVLIDTPELWDEDGVENLELVKDCLALSLPGPHAFLLVVQVGRFTQDETEMLGRMQKTFGRDVADHTVVLFTRCDDSQQHRVQSIDDYVANAHGSLQDLIRKCGSRYYVLNIRNFRNVLSYPQVKELMSAVNKLVASHGGDDCVAKRFPVEELKERMKTIEQR